MNLFLGLDSSTQSLSAIVIDADAGQIVKEVSLNYGRELPQFNCPQGVLVNPDPLVCHADPLLWAAALDLLCAELRNQGVPLAEIRGISGSGQQHGTVYLDGCFADSRITWDPRSDLVTILRPHLTRKSAPIWMDSSTTVECAEIGKAAGGSERVRTLSGSPPVERFSGPQIRRFWKLEPAAYEQTGVVHLVSSFMASLLTGRSAGIDFGDGAGMNLLNLNTNRWDNLLLEATAPKLESRLPCALPSATRVGTVSPYFVVKYGFSAGTPVIAWSGDNPCSLIGVGAWEPGTAVVSLGTSYTFFAAMPEPLVDPHGYGHVFGNPAGGFMSLICFKNGALAQERVRDQFKLDWRQFETWLGATPAGNGGNMMLPYFVPEITPLVLAAKPAYRGTPEFVAGRDVAAAVRAVVEAQALRLRLHSAWMGQKTDRLRVTGGVSTSRGTCQILADVFNARVERLVTGNSAALGAALRAAQAVSGKGWAELSTAFCAPVPGADITPIPVNVATYATVLPAYKVFVESYKG